MPLSEAADEYFSQINPIASRIYADFQDTKNTYECLWKTLSFAEQTQILNESIIKPEITLKYNLNPALVEQLNNNKNDSCAFANKRVIDENVSYRDEHSAPFSFKSLSQVDLRLFGGELSKKVMVTPKIEPPKLQAKIEPNVPEPVPARYKTDTSIFGKLLGRKQSPDAEQEVLVSPQSNSDSSGSTLPKTGLDFLDNW